MTQREINNKALEFAQQRKNESGGPNIDYEKVDDRHYVAYNIHRKEGFIAGVKWILKQTKKYKLTELEQFVHDHIQQKIDNNELHLTGISMSGDTATFEREFEIYQNALLEGIVNGIIMCDGDVEGIETD